MDNTTLTVLILVGVFLLWYAFIFCVGIYVRKDSKTKYEPSVHFDERQRSDQLTAYKLAFWTLVGVFFIYEFLKVWVEIPDISAGFLLEVAAFLAIAVFLCCCILRDALFGYDLKKFDRNLCIIAWNVVLGFMLLLLLCEVLEDGALKDGGTFAKLVTPLLSSMLFVMADVCLIVRKRLDRKEAKRD